MNFAESDDPRVDLRVKHLSMVQSNIARMGTLSAAVKNYCMTMTAGIIGLAAAVHQPKILIYALPVLLIFAIQDAAYLRVERGLRSQYDLIRMSSADIDFAIAPGKSTFTSVLHAMISWSVVGFYGSLSIVLIGMYFSMS